MSTIAAGAEPQASYSIPARAAECAIISLRLCAIRTFSADLDVEGRARVEPIEAAHGSTNAGRRTITAFLCGCSAITTKGFHMVVT
ncbi:hypothetical protein Ga0100231_005935 [Opitutaceae bacterium TAV4]|nr:hypothetical protein Ga0100231_005935 [Opitutaceae bacterium TAV4]RRK02513.1 hypothetical protein Ga0100230_005145 [Opitutaceae bacterium TAV3]